MGIPDQNRYKYNSGVFMSKPSEFDLECNNLGNNPFNMD